MSKVTPCLALLTSLQTKSPAPCRLLLPLLASHVSPATCRLLLPEPEPEPEAHTVCRDVLCVWISVRSHSRIGDACVPWHRWDVANTEEHGILLLEVQTDFDGPNRCMRMHTCGHAHHACSSAHMQHHTCPMSGRPTSRVISSVRRSTSTSTASLSSRSLVSSRVSKQAGEQPTNQPTNQTNKQTNQPSEQASKRASEQPSKQV